jgi:hypothetical protein
MDYLGSCKDLWDSAAVVYGKMTSSIGGFSEPWIRLGLNSRSSTSAGKRYIVGKGVLNILAENPTQICELGYIV